MASGSGRSTERREKQGSFELHWWEVGIREEPCGGTPARPFSLFCSHTTLQPGPCEGGKINSSSHTFVLLPASDHFKFHKEASRWINRAQRWGVGFLLLWSSCGM